MISRDLHRIALRTALRMAATFVAIACGPVPTAFASSFECIIEPDVEVEISSAVPGIVEAVEVERGDEVEKGQVLVRLVSGVELANHELAKARAEFAKRKNERNADLVEERLISSNEKDQIETEELLARLELRESKERLALRTVRSPIDGVVVDVDVSPGEYVSDGEIMKLARLHPLNVEVVVPVSAFGSVARGMRATVRPEFPFEGDRKATVTIVDRVVDAASGTVGVRLELPNLDHELPGGLKCSVEFEEVAPAPAP